MSYNTFSGVKNSDFGDISGRLQLIQDLKCHSFQWFLQHVYPDSYFPDDHQLYTGQVSKINFNICDCFFLRQNDLPIFRFNINSLRNAWTQLAAKVEK